ncbi:unnamed protein product [Ascophyllum nodosum]
MRPPSPEPPKGLATGHSHDAPPDHLQEFATTCHHVDDSQLKPILSIPDNRPPSNSRLQSIYQTLYRRGGNLVGDMLEDPAPRSREHCASAPRDECFIRPIARDLVEPR